MKDFVLKYVFIVIFFLALGGGSVLESMACISSSSKNDMQEEVTVSSQSADEVHTIIMETFSSIRQVETLQISGRGQGQEFYRFISVYSKIRAILLVKKVDACNYMHLLSERYYQGFYVFSLEKLII